MDPLTHPRRWEVLFVDDSPAHARIVHEALKGGRGLFRLRVATTGNEALDRLLRRPPYEAARLPDVVLLDIELPEVSGLDVLAEVKTRDDLRWIPVIVVAREGRTDDLAECYRRGANSVVISPIELEAMAQTYRAIIDYWTHVHRGASDAES